MPSAGSKTALTGIERFFSQNGPLSKQFSRYEERPSQIEMAKKVMEALVKEDQVMIEAGTGTGKTFAYLVPALLSGKKVILSTGTRHLQDQIYFKDLPVLREIFSRPVSALLMKGKENYLCKYRYAGFSSSPLLYKREETLYLDQMMAWARQTEKGDKAELTGIPEDLELVRPGPSRVRCGDF
ncbi:MAG: DEAD/DEAH box helicase [Nitrospirae bacterium]|nr:DEAD/DEAH box helicase [Nitrospirota bacterium]